MRYNSDGSLILWIEFHCLEELQLDFGLGAPINEGQGKGRRSWVLRLVLSYSRKGYSEAVTSAGHRARRSCAAWKMASEVSVVRRCCLPSILFRGTKSSCPAANRLKYSQFLEKSGNGVQQKTRERGVCTVR